MDILYQYYLNFLKELGVSEALIFFFWYIFPFALACVAFFLVSNILFWIDKKLFNLIYGQEKLPLLKFNYFEKSNFAVVLLVSFSIFLWGLIPYSNKYIPINSDISSLLFLSVLCGFILLVLFFAKEQGGKIWGLKLIAGISSFLLPMFFALLSIVFLASSLNLNEIVLFQSLLQNTIGWLITPALVGFFIFVGGIVGLFSFFEKSLNISGFCRYKIKNRGSKIFLLCYYSLIFVLSIYSVCLFLGGYLPPLGFYISEIYKINYVLNTSAVYLEQIFWLLLKSLFLFVLIMGIKIKVIKLSTDDLLKFSWGVLLPASILNLVICMIIPLLGAR